MENVPVGAAGVPPHVQVVVVGPAADAGLQAIPATDTAATAIAPMNARGLMGLSFPAARWAPLARRIKEQLN
jgi:hypothetical protein